MSTNPSPVGNAPLDASRIADLKLAASKMLGAARRSFQASIALKYCEGVASRCEKVFGWNRHSVALGLNEKRTGIICLGAQEAFSGNKLWEVKHPEVAKALWALVESHAQQDPNSRGTPRLTAREALQQLRDLGFAEEVLPAPSTMADALNRNGYRVRRAGKTKPQSPKSMPSSPSPGRRTGKYRMGASPGD